LAAGSDEQGKQRDVSEVNLLIAAGCLVKQYFRITEKKNATLIQRRRSFTTVAIEPMSMREMRVAANSFGFPSITACQLY
jgi:hypothetical protein